MNIIKYTLIVLYIIFCSCTENEKLNYVILKGEVKNSLNEILNVHSLKGFTKSININSKGQFVDTLHVEEGLYNISFGKDFVNVYMKPGEVISCTADAKNFGKTIQFKGDNFSLNNYFAYKANSVKNFRKNAKEIYLMKETAFEKRIKSLQNDLESKLMHVNHITKELRSAERRSINYGRLKNKDLYENFHSYYTENNNFKVSEKFTKELECLDLTNTKDFFFSTDYFQLVSSSLHKETVKTLKNDSVPYEFAELDIASKLENTIIGNHLMFDNVRRSLTITNDKKSLLDKYMKLSSDEGLKLKIQNLYNEIAMLDIGKPSPKFVNYENYSGGTTSLDDLNGKYVYIDIWATWCGPCKQEIPFLKEVEKKYHGKNIEFVSISVDNMKDHKKWKEIIAEEKMKGLQLFADKSFNSDFIQAYKINGVPHFILLDEQGNIVDANAPKPSDKKLIELLTKQGI